MIKPSLSALFAAVTIAASTLVLTPTAFSHCQVPCGIYDDEARLTALAEHVTTIDKAVAQIGEYAGADDAQSAQQLARWVATKEAHAQEIQQVALDYFLAQRIKFPADDAGDAAKAAYGNHLALLHQIIVHAMKCKQNAAAENVEALGAAVASFSEAYRTATAG